MSEPKEYDVLVIVTPQDFQRTIYGRKRLIECLPVRRVIFVGNNELGCLIKEENLGDKVRFLNENDLIRFDSVYSVVEDVMSDFLKGRKLPRGVVGWYYQQFLKMEYARHCTDEYYLVWDGDTVPTKELTMFAEDRVTPFLDVKQEYHAEYFDTLYKILPGFKKVIGPSFISEHMLINCEIMKAMLDDIENDYMITRKVCEVQFYEAIIRRINAEKMQDASFSEFETYGTYVALKYPGKYRLREWHSFRLGAEFFHPEAMSESDYEWLAKDFQAISFEKNQSVREDHENLFNNKEYQGKISARKMLEIAQEEFTEGYKEEWNTFSDDAIVMDRENVLKAYDAGQNQDWTAMYEAIELGLKDNFKNYELYILLGEYYLLTEGNVNKTYLCYENALHYCSDANDRKQIEGMISGLSEQYDITVKPLSFVIVSWNNRDIMEDCIRSIRRTVPLSAREIIVVDNASTDGITEWLKGQLDVRLICNVENVGFGEGSNQGLEIAFEGNDIFFLNNDTIVTPNAVFWLRMALYDSDSDYVAAGCCTNYEGSKQPPIQMFDTLQEYLRFADINNVLMDDPYDERKWLSGFALAFRRTVLDEIGGFDLRYGMGYFEDTDLCERARRAGCVLRMCKNSYIYHYGSKSFGLQYEKATELVLTNRQRFIDKWGYDPYA